MSPDVSILSLCNEEQVLRELYLMRQVESSDAQGPETAQHWKDTEAQVVSRGHHQEVVLTLWVTWVLTLQKVHKDTGNDKLNSLSRAGYSTLVKFCTLLFPFQVKEKH